MARAPSIPGWETWAQPVSAARPPASTSPEDPRVADPPFPKDGQGAPTRHVAPRSIGQALGPDPSARAVVVRAFLGSRLIVLFAGVLAVLEIGQAAGQATNFDPEGLTRPFGYFGNLLAAPFARWDSAWYLGIASGGYHSVQPTAFYPLYPLMLRGIGIVIGSDLIAGVLVSLVAFIVALALLYRLARLELDSPRAEATVMLIAFCPMAYFFSAIYTESLYLALSLGCLLCARSGRWFWAGLLGGLAALSRNSGVVLVVPVVLMFLYGPRTDAAPSPRRSGLRALVPRYRLRGALLWAALIPLGLVAYLAYLGIDMHDAFAPFHAQVYWARHFTLFGGVWQGAVAAWDGVRQLLHGPAPPVYFTQAGGDPLNVAGQNLLEFVALLIGIVALVGTFRRLPFVYGAYVFFSLAMPLSDPDSAQPLASLPRYEVVLFPLFMWAASVLYRRNLVAIAIGVGAVLLGLFTADFATWRFVA